MFIENCKVRGLLQEGRYVQAIMSTDHPSCPLVDGVVRAKVRSGR